jgi:hypothetical protein
MENNPYPYLDQLLGGYFHQDAYVDGDTDESILANYIQTSWDYQRLGVRADILRFLHNHPSETKQAVESTFQPDITVGKDDAAVRYWLLMLLHSLTNQADETNSWDYQRLGVQADILRFLHNHPSEIKQAFESTFQPDRTVGEDDAAVRDWLQMMLHSLANQAEEPNK